MCVCVCVHIHHAYMHSVGESWIPYIMYVRTYTCATHTSYMHSIGSLEFRHIMCVYVCMHVHNCA